MRKVGVERGGFRIGGGGDCMHTNTRQHMSRERGLGINECKTEDP